jgi:hypothetical protein
MTIRGRDGWLKIEIGEGLGGGWTWKEMDGGFFGGLTFVFGFWSSVDAHTTQQQAHPLAAVRGRQHLLGRHQEAPGETIYSLKSHIPMHHVTNSIKY